MTDTVDDIVGTPPSEEARWDGLKLTILGFITLAVGVGAIYLAAALIGE